MVRARLTRVATDATSSPGSTGLARCISKPLRSARVRSSDRANAVSAAAGVSRTSGFAEARMREINSKPSTSGIPRSMTSACGLTAAIRSSASAGDEIVTTSAPAAGNTNDEGEE